jgi:hypothetical protein
VLFRGRRMGTLLLGQSFFPLVFCMPVDGRGCGCVMLRGHMYTQPWECWTLVCVACETQRPWVCSTVCVGASSPPPPSLLPHRHAPEPERDANDFLKDAILIALGDDMGLETALELQYVSLLPPPIHQYIHPSIHLSVRDLASPLVVWVPVVVELAVL